MGVRGRVCHSEGCVIVRGVSFLSGSWLAHVFGCSVNGNTLRIITGNYY